MDKIYIFLPVHNRREITRRFVQCLKRQTYENYHLMLIDDGSTDGTEEMVRGEIGPLTVIKGRGGWWWAGSLEQGYKWLKSRPNSRSDAVLIINDDLEFEADFLERGMTLLYENTNVLLLAQCYIRDDKRLYDVGVHADWRRLTFEQATRPADVNCLSTRGLFLRAADFFKIGGFYPRLIPHYLSDYEFTIRAHRKGMKLMTDPSLKVWLDEGATGYNKIENETFSGFMKKFFSKKSMSNPLAWSFFLLLACPWPWKMVHVIKIWIYTFYVTGMYFLKSMKRRLAER